jgi:hypothetical protein
MKNNANFTRATSKTLSVKTFNIRGRCLSHEKLINNITQILFCFARSIQFYFRLEHSQSPLKIFENLVGEFKFTRNLSLKNTIFLERNKLKKSTKIIKNSIKIN